MQAQAINDTAAEFCLDHAAFTAFLEYENFDDAQEAAEAFQDQYAGTYDSLAQWAEELSEETGLLDSMPRNLRAYFDFEAYGRDCELDGSVWTADTPAGVAVFWQR